MLNTTRNLTSNSEPSTDWLRDGKSEGKSCKCRAKHILLLAGEVDFGRAKCFEAFMLEKPRGKDLRRVHMHNYVRLPPGDRSTENISRSFIWLIINGCIVRNWEGAADLYHPRKPEKDGSGVPVGPRTLSYEVV